MSTLSHNECVAVEYALRKNCIPIKEKEDFCLQNVIENSFAIEFPLHLLAPSKSYNIFEYEEPFIDFLLKRYKNVDTAFKIVTDAKKRNLSLNSGFLRIDMLICKNRKFTAIEWNDYSTHYSSNGFFDLTHRNYSDFIKSLILSDNKNIAFKEVMLCGDTKTKERKIKRILSKILKDSA